jgi:hypothetical protein
MKQDEWTQQLYDKLAQHEIAAPDDLWADIEAALQQQQTAASHSQTSKTKKSSRSRFVALRRWAVAAAFAAMALGGGVLWWSQSNYQAEVSQEQVASVDSQNNNDTIDDSESNTLLAETSTPPSTYVPKNQSVSQEPLIETSSDIVSPAETSSDNVSTVETSTDIASPADASTTPSTQHPAPSTQRPTPIIHHLKPTSRRPSISLFAMNGFSSQSSRNGILMAPSLVNQYSDTYANSDAVAARRYDIFQLDGYEERQHHDLPLSYGLTVSYPLTERLSLTTGVTYTKLRSNFTQVMRSMQIQREQTLHYVGIPLTANYQLWSLSSSVLHLPSSLQTYVSAGIKADWNVATHLETEGVVQQLPKDRLQWSLNGSLGVQYDIVPQLGVYVEPGLTWYPDNGSSLQNYFKYKPLNFSLQLGLRLNLER